MLKTEALAIIASKIAECTKCAELTAYRIDNNYKTVPGEGNPVTRIMFVGEAPGQNEAESGRPFVGRAGKLLDSLIGRVGWSRSNVFITNTIKCRPPGNRDPKLQETTNCLPFLKLQIEVIKPQYIICVGRVAALNLLKPQKVDEKWWFNRSLNSLRHEFHDYNGIKTLCTYHPSYLLRTPKAEIDFINDLMKVVQDINS
jgi:DNA polymerase